MERKGACVLLIDDEPDILEIIRYNLSSEGYRVLTAENGAEGLRLAKKHRPRLIILDVMMPGMDGIETCAELRKDPALQETIITFLTARGEDFSQLAGLESGADDYITKPVSPGILVSKVKALLRRSPQHRDMAQVIIAGDLIIDRSEYSVVKNEEELNLPRKEFELLYFLASEPGRVFKREHILEQVWGNEIFSGSRTIDVHIRKLREKIGEDRFRTVKGIGYKFTSKE